jgi:hypothetical protein
MTESYKSVTEERSWQGKIDHRKATKKHNGAYTGKSALWSEKRTRYHT